MFQEDSIRMRAEQILIIRSGACLKEVRESYRRLSLRYHPDRNPGDSSSTKKMQLITQAYKFLLGKKLGYDDGSTQYDLLEDDDLVRAVLPKGVEPQPFGETYMEWHRRQFYESWI